MGNRKTELLLPAGNTESFYAALDGGADAVYLGLKNFNARGRAANFGESHLMAALKEAQKRKVKIYVTLNTVIKNKEIDDLLDVLLFWKRQELTRLLFRIGVCTTLPACVFRNWLFMPVPKWGITIR